jgi:hypothetical protein
LIIDHYPHVMGKGSSIETERLICIACLLVTLLLLVCAFLV